MEKTFFNNPIHYIFYICVFISVYSPYALLADHNCNFEYCGLEVDFEEPTNYEELGEYEDMFRTFEEKIQEEENEFDIECGVFKKWGKKLKKWLKKRTVSLIKKCVDLKKIRNPEDCAYTVAKFKRKVDKVHKTGNIESMFEEFDKHVPEDPHIASFDKFKSRIKYYYDNRHAKPPKNKVLNSLSLCIECRRPEYNGELDHIPTRALIGGVEIWNASWANSIYEKFIFIILNRLFYHTNWHKSGVTPIFACDLLQSLRSYSTRPEDPLRSSSL